ncbi:BTAD domain-containing putative transcriptional regulator [Streptomyces sp. NPDC101206]|uniref:AfsR/SARP family transcriptional regulator n=1 Tax=Streptomyces sp. NPDC101206 TaxID=3366128 RepID=UPI003812BBE8
MPVPIADLNPGAAPQIGILGPLEVHPAGQFEHRVSVGGIRIRALLGALTARRGKVMTSEQILKEVWSESQPVTERKAVAVAVLRLRRVLGDSEGKWLLTRPSGYVLNVPPGHVDAVRAERLVREGKDALTAGQAGLASRCLTRALAHWRGDPYTDAGTSPAVIQHVTELESLRSEAVQARIDADLALGQHRELIGELRSLTAANPLHEPHWLQLMLALYRSGKQAEALAAYVELRRTLADNMGVDPGQQLQDLYLRMLRVDTGLLTGPVPTLSWQS